ncbi:MAG: hypothetical protein ACI9VS_001762 [Candidatus Binatia bacterium]|jgi:hypothetical protein
MPLKKFNTLIHDGLSELKRRLPERRIGGRDAEELAESIDGLNFPATVAFLGASESPRDGSQRELIEQAAANVARDEEMRKLGVEAHVVEDSVNDLMRNHAPADRALGRLSRVREARQLIFDGVVRELMKAAGLPSVTPGEVHQIAAVLQSREFYGDFASASAALAKTVKSAPKAVLTDTAAMLDTARGVPTNVLDLGTESMPRDPSVPPPFPSPIPPPAPIPPTETRSESAQSVAELTRSLIGRENKTVRAAVIIYARVNGIPLRARDLDTLHDHALTGDKPEIGPLLVAGFDRFVAGLGNYGLREALRRMGLK